MGLAIAENRILVLQRTAQVIQIVPLEMPVDMSYESDSDDDAPKTQNAKRSNNKAPSLNDSEAFPETLGGGAPVEASAVPNFAGLAASFQGQELAQSQRAEPVRKPVMRLPRVHKIYKDRSVANKPLSNDWTLYVDEGIQGSEKSAECESTSCGTIHTMKEFFPAWTSRNCSHIRTGWQMEHPCVKDHFQRHVRGARTLPARRTPWRDSCRHSFCNS